MKEEQITAIENALAAAEKCYYAFNKLAVVTRVHFTFAGVDLHDAMELLEGWLKALKEDK